MWLHSFSSAKFKNFLLFISIFLMLPSSTEERVFSTQGRSLFIQKKLSKEGGEGMLMVNSVIGSRPPRCERRCVACSHCEAVQVPSTASVHSFMNTNEKDEHSNYKPMSWKCKCGSFIFNP